MMSEGIKTIKKYLLIIFALVVFQPVQAQGWLKTYDAGRGRDVIAGENGGYAVLTDDKLIKVNKQGEAIWEYPEGGIRMVQTPDSNYLFINRIGTDKFSLTKIQQTGILEWQKTFQGYASLHSSKTLPLKVTTDSGIVVGAYDDKYLRLVKLNASGNIEWESKFGDTTIINKSVRDMVVTDDGGFAVLAAHPNDYFLYRLDSVGNWIWEQSLTDSIEIPEAIVQTPDGGFMVCGVGYNTQYPTYKIAQPVGIIKVDAMGQHEWFKNEYIAHGYGPENYFIVLTWFNQAWDIKIHNGEVYIACIAYTGDPEKNNPHLGWGIADPALIKIDPAGNILLSKKVVQTPFKYEMPLALAIDNNGGVIMTGFTNGNKAFILKTDSLGNVYSNLIKGYVYRDNDDDCMQDSTDRGLYNWIIEARGNQTFYAMADTSGYYELHTDSGDYVVSVFVPNNLWEPCQDSVSLSFPGYYMTDSVDFGIKVVAQCPYLQVDIATPFLRRCFENYYYVHYCNTGTDTAKNAYVIVQLDPYLELVHSDSPYILLPDSTYQFNLGDVVPGQCGQFRIRTYLDCDSTFLGQTHCVEAHIYPDSFCISPDSLWSGASLIVDGYCDGDSVVFIIKNIGDAAMIAPTQFIVVEDDMILMQEPLPPLDSGAIYEVKIAAIGTTLRMVAEQVSGHPGNSMPTLAIEGCGGGSFSFGFVTQFPNDDSNPFIDIDCRENIGSWDPNDKRGFPGGYTSENLIQANTEIEYMIRFQNTGTDTAFSVTIMDTLSSFLDLATLRPGASSHPYQFSFTHDGVVMFTFENIALPDSNVNALESHGFVKFKITQKQDNPVGTKIYNKAAIYFDFNTPVITNETMHTVGEKLIIVAIDEVQAGEETVEVQVFPNPFSSITTFVLEDTEISNGCFSLYTSSGELVQRQKFSKPQFEFYRNNLPGGFYFFRIELNGQLMRTGKVVIVD